MKKIGLLFASLWVAAFSFAEETVSLSQLDLKLMTDVRIGTLVSPPPPEANRSRGGLLISIAGKEFKQGVAMRGYGRWLIELDGQAQTLHTWIGLTDDSDATGPAWFEILGDGRILYASEPMERGEAAREVTVPLGGIKTLALVVQSPDVPETFTVWADASITYAGARPKAVAPEIEKPYLLTPPAPASPRINGAKVFGARPGNPFLFSIPATGERPLMFKAKNLPTGLKLDAATGRITGTVAKPGEYRVQLSAVNRHGTATRELRIVIGEHLALTPPMGWNSWNCFANAVTQEDIKAAADAMVRTGLDQHGWNYINIDDFWTNRPVASDPLWRDIAVRQKAKNIKKPVYKAPPADDPTLIGPSRDEKGDINTNQRFPDMQGLVDHVHSLGLKIGLYSSPGPVSCGRCAASYGHEVQDAKRVAAWGFDYFKYDWCSYRFYIADDSRAELMKPYQIMGDALRAQKRDIIFSFCQYGMGNVGEWAPSVGGHTWRTTYDINDSWADMSGIGFSQNGQEVYVGPTRGWTDVDIFVLGHIGWGRKQHPTQLTPDEQYTHFSLWSMLASTLLIGCDMTKLDEFTLNLLTNDEVIAVNQDSLGRAASRISQDRNLEVWARPLEEGSMAVALFNRGEVPAEVTARWSDLKISGPHIVRDLWRQKDLEVADDTFAAAVPRHGVVMVKLTLEKK